MHVNKTALVVLLAGMIIVAAGFFLIFFWMEGLEQGEHVVKAGGRLELSWYLQKGDRTEGGFRVSGGNLEANLIIKNPSGGIIENWTADGRYDSGFTAQDTGIYTMVFKNLDNVNDQTVGVYFLSPYEARITIYDAVGFLMVVGGVVVFFLSVRSIKRAPSRRVEMTRAKNSEREFAAQCLSLKILMSARKRRIELS